MINGAIHNWCRPAGRRKIHTLIGREPSRRPDDTDDDDGGALLTSAPQIRLVIVERAGRLAIASASVPYSFCNARNLLRFAANFAC
jgi:hypothetical protein